MRSLYLVPCTAAVAATVLGSAAAQTSAPQFDLRPSVVRLGERSAIRVSGVHARSLKVRLAGAAHVDGRAFTWHPLRLVGGTWRGTLPLPPVHGVYPVLLRTRAGELRPGLFLRVLPPGALSRPSFADPADAARWWVRSVPHGTLVALKPWPRSGLDRRDARLHRLFVVSYSPAGDAEPLDQRGMFVTAFRDGYSGGWRFLEASVQP
jgi:hypothetical protein